MNKKIYLILFGTLTFLYASKSIAYDYMTTRLRLEREINYICSSSIGVSIGSWEYQECRNYYDQRLYDYGYDWDYITPSQITTFLARTTPFITHCRNRGLISSLLWGCIRDYEDRHYHDWYKKHSGFKHHKKYKPHFSKEFYGKKEKHHFDHKKPAKPDFEHGKPDHKNNKKSAKKDVSKMMRKNINAK